MDHAARVAFIHSMNINAQAELIAMQQEDAYEVITTGKPKHSPEEYRAVPYRFGITHNQVIEYLREY